jgi:hypothetical protein
LIRAQIQQLTIGEQVEEIALEFGYLGNLGATCRSRTLTSITFRPTCSRALKFPCACGGPIRNFPGDTAQVQILSPNWGLSNYHTFVLISEKRGFGFGWLFTYTLSKWIDNVVFVGGDDATFGDEDQVQA